MLSILFIFTALALLFAPIFILIFAPGFYFDIQKQDLAVSLLRIMFPYLALISLVAFAAGIQNSHNKFSIPAVTPLIFNLSLIGSAWLVAPKIEIPVMASYDVAIVPSTIVTNALIFLEILFIDLKNTFLLDLLDSLGVFSIVLEMVSSQVAKIITEKISVPTIGIGSGKNCDGQVLVVHDMLGLFEKIKPKFAKRYLSLSEEIRNAVKSYVEEVKNEKFPAIENEFQMDEDEYNKLRKEIV